jgi:hypothetical protein
MRVCRTTEHENRAQRLERRNESKGLTAIFTAAAASKELTPRHLVLQCWRRSLKRYATRVSSKGLGGCHTPAFCKKSVELMENKGLGCEKRAQKGKKSVQVAETKRAENRIAPDSSWAQSSRPSLAAPRAFVRGRVTSQLIPGRCALKADCEAAICLYQATYDVRI